MSDPLRDDTAPPAAETPAGPSGFDLEPRHPHVPPGFPGEPTFEEALAQYDAVGKKDAPEQAPEEGLDERGMHLLPSDAPQDLRAAFDGQVRGLMEDRLYTDELAHELGRALDRLDLTEMLRTIREEIPESSGMSDDMALSYLKALYDQDEKVKRDWDNRRSNPSAWQNRQAYVLHRVQNELRRLPDREATADRDLVTQAMRGAGRDAAYSPPCQTSTKCPTRNSRTGPSGTTATRPKSSKNSDGVSGLLHWAGRPGATAAKLQGSIPFPCGLGRAPF